MNKVATMEPRARAELFAETAARMGMFDAQIVVQSVENVTAVDESVIRKSASKPPIVGWVLRLSPD